MPPQLASADPIEVINRLREGDVLTHCFRLSGGASGLTVELRRNLEAREIMVRYCHGVGSFGFKTAETMLNAGFLPDAISSDIHSLSIKVPPRPVEHAI